MTPLSFLHHGGRACEGMGCVCAVGLESLTGHDSPLFSSSWWQGM